MKERERGKGQARGGWGVASRFSWCALVGDLSTGVCVSDGAVHSAGQWEV